MICVIDYGAGNLRSVENALKYLDVPFTVTSQAAEVAEAAAILLPGVGHFGQMMRSLDVLGLAPILRRAITRGVPYLGICLGMHALFEGSAEAPAWPGLAILPGQVRRIPEGLKVPHMGWNQLQMAPGSRLFAGIASSPFVYFAHSYYVPVEAFASSGDQGAQPAALADYGTLFVAAVERENICGVQFHPEKSGEIGLEMLRNFAREAKGAKDARTPPGRTSPSQRDSRAG